MTQPNVVHSDLDHDLLCRLDREKNSLQEDNDALRDVIDRKNRDLYNTDKRLKTTDNQLKVYFIDKVVIY